MLVRYKINISVCDFLHVSYALCLVIDSELVPWGKGNGNPTANSLSTGLSNLFYECLMTYLLYNGPASLSKEAELKQ